MKQQYLCTRPRLASVLIRAGATVTEQVNPFKHDPKHDLCWAVDLDENSAKVITDFYHEIGKPLPAPVAIFVYGGGNNV